jgi:prepilin-type processing-associated H-X9-DG protein
MGSFQMPSPGDPFAVPCNGRHEHGILLRLLPFYEQGSLYNAFNSNIHYMNYANTTINVTGISTLWCPSDAAISNTTTVPAGDDSSLPTDTPMRHNSYSGCTGTWMMPGRYQIPDTCGIFSTAYAQGNGVFYMHSKTTIASITDGTSNTMSLGECAFGLLSQGDQACWHWWTSGNYGDTMFCTLYPLNPQRKVSDLGSIGGEINADAFTWTASSFHPGGGNFAFCDGSVRFIKDSISSLPINPATNYPQGYAYNGSVWTQTGPNAVYQALSTRAGGEVVSSDSY